MTEKLSDNDQELLNDWFENYPFYVGELGEYIVVKSSFLLEIGINEGIIKKWDYQKPFAMEEAKELCKLLNKQ